MGLFLDRLKEQYSSYQRVDKWGMTDVRLARQTQAVRTLSSVLNRRLQEKMSDRDRGTDKSIYVRRFDAFFKSKETEHVFRITSVGLPDAIEQFGGMFLYVYEENKDGNTKEVINLQIAKTSEAIEWPQVWQLSHYLPEDLISLSGMVETGVSIEEGEFKKAGGFLYP